MADLELELGRPIYRECRACLKIGQSGGFADIFMAKDSSWCWSKKDTTIAEELARIANVEVSNTDKCSDVVCFNCCFKLHNASQFITMVQESDQILKTRQHHQSTNNNKWPKPIQLETEVNGAVLGNVPEVEIKQEVLSEEENDLSDSIDSSNQPDLQMEIKVEPEEIQQFAPIKVMVNGTISADQMKETSNGCEIYYDEEYLTQYTKDEPVSDEEESGSFDLPLECMLCAKRFLSVSGLKAHVVTSHSYKSVRRRTGAERSPAKKKRHICTICRRCFSTLTDLMVHETCHNKFHCYGCRLQFDSFGALLQHRARARCLAPDAQPHPLKTLKDAVRPAPTEVYIRKKYDNYIKCTKCNEVLPDEYYMNVHYDIHHSSSNSETDNDNVLCNKMENESLQSDEKDKRNENETVDDEKNKRKETTSVEAEEKDKRNETISVEAEEKDKRNETINIEAEEKDKRNETTSVEAEEKDKIKETSSIEAEEKDKRSETTSVEDVEKDKISETTSVKAEEKDKRKEITSVKTTEKDNIKEATSVEAEEKISNQKEAESHELEMQKNHEENSSGSPKNNCIENIENSNISQDSETPNKKIGIHESLDKIEKSDKVKEILIEVNVKSLTDSNNLKTNTEISKEIKQEPEPEPMDDETDRETNSNKNDGDTNKLGSTDSVGGQKNMIEIEIDTVRSVKDNIKEELDDNFACSMMKMDSY